MKILTLCDYQMDYLAESILVGLWETGHDIYEMPVLKHVRGEVDEGYSLPDGKRGLTGPPGHLLPNVLPQQPHSRDEVYDLAIRNAFDLVILLSHREHAIAALQELFEYGIQPGRLPLVSCDGEDHIALNLQTLADFHIRVHFKRDLVRSGFGGRTATITDYTSNNVPIWPLPISAFVRNYPEDLSDDESVKDCDFFLIQGNTYPARDILTKECLEYCVEQNLNHLIATDHTSRLFSSDTPHPYVSQLRQARFPWLEFMAKLAHAKVTAVMRGWGWESLHAWEAFSFATAVLYCDPKTYIPYPFLDETHCLYIEEDGHDVKFKLQRLFEDASFRKAIAIAGKRHLYAHHTNLKRANYLIEVACKTIYGLPPSSDEYQMFDI